MSVRARNAFTLVEIMVSIICMAILMTPVVYVYRSGSRNALAGLVKAEITMEAGRILRQIHDDLKYSAFSLDYSKPPSSNATYYFDTILGGDKDSIYSLLRFPLHGSINDAIVSTGNAYAYRTPVRITYSLKKEDELLYSLYRSEGTMKPALLSRRVNFFEIRENRHVPDKTCWFVTLQLAEAVKPIPGDPNVQRIQGSQGLSVKATERRLIERSRGVQIADFFDVVASEYYSIFRKTQSIPNWQTLLKEP